MSGGIVFAGLSPHPPILIPDIGKEELSKCMKSRLGLQTFSKRLAESKPEILVLITPHGPTFYDALSVYTVSSYSGNFAPFGASSVKIEARGEPLLASRIIGAARESKISVLELNEDSFKKYRISPSLDHATMVPLCYFREAGLDVPMVLISIGYLSFPQLYEFGERLAEAIAGEKKRVAVIASGDLSHRLIPTAPAGYDPIGKEFDRKMVDLLKARDGQGILKLDSDLVERAGECGFRPILILMGAGRSLEMDSDVISYEGPFGVGYACVAYTPKPRSLESFATELAKDSLVHFLTRGEYLPLPADIPEPFRERKGVFVTLKKGGELRGCIGTITPATPGAASEIIRNAVSAATHDPRFPPVSIEEVPYISFSVDVLEAPEPVAGESELDPKIYGVIVRSGKRSGLLLPDLEGVEIAAHQVQIARQKAGISPSEKIELHRFKVIRYGQK